MDQFVEKNIINPLSLKSWLYVPAIKEKFIEKVLSLRGIDKPDAIIFDLEDSIASTIEAKERGRDNLLDYLFYSRRYRNAFYSNFVIAIRINGISSPYYSKDKEAIKMIAPHFVVIPKIDTAEQIAIYKQEFENIQLRVIIETLLGYRNRDAIMGALTSKDVVSIGYEDLSADLGIERPDDFTQPNPLVHIINECIISAKQHKIVLAEGPSRKYATANNLSVLEKECRLSLQMGFQSKGAIHPSQIKIINDVFCREKMKKHAKDVLQLFDTLADGTCVVATDTSEMIDTPSVQMYSRVLEQLES